MYSAANVAETKEGRYRSIIPSIEISVSCEKLRNGTFTTKLARGFRYRDS
jgi:hypothetical protein